MKHSSLIELSVAWIAGHGHQDEGHYDSRGTHVSSAQRWKPTFGHMVGAWKGCQLQRTIGVRGKRSDSPVRVPCGAHHSKCRETGNCMNLKFDRLTLQCFNLCSFMSLILSDRCNNTWKSIVNWWWDLQFHVFDSKRSVQWKFDQLMVRSSCHHHEPCLLVAQCLPDMCCTIIMCSTWCFSCSSRFIEPVAL